MSFSEKFKPLNDCVLVKLDPRQVYSEILAIPQVRELNHPVSKGTVVSVGPGRWKKRKADRPERVFIPVEARPGMKIVFFSAAMHEKQGENFCHDMPDDHALIRDGDILFAFEDDVKVEV